MQELAPIRDALADGKLVVFVGRDASTLPAGMLTPAALTTAVARVPTLTFVTLAPTPDLAAALETAGHTPNLLADNQDLDNRTPGRPDVIFLTGMESRPSTLMITEAQFTAGAPAHRRNLFDRLADWCVDRPVLFVGCNPTTGSDFERLVYARLLRHRNVGRKGDTLIWPGANAATIARWQPRGIQVLDAQPLDVLAHLAAVQVIPEDPEERLLAGLANLLTGSAGESEITAALQAAAVVEPIEIALRLRLWLEQDGLHAMLDIAYEPPVAAYSDLPFATGVALKTLTDWADMTEKLLVNAVPLDNPAVQDPARSIFDALLPPGSERRRQYELALDRARILDARLTIQYIVHNPGELAPIPWELLYDKHVPLGRGYHAISYPVLRLPDGVTAVTSVSRLSGDFRRALLVGVDPDGTLASLPDEVNELKQLLLDAKPDLDITVLSTDASTDGPPDRATILAHLADAHAPYQLLHFTGHGSFARFKPEDSALHVVDENGHKTWLTAEDLGRAAVDGGLKLVVLSACSVGLTQEAAGQIAGPVPAWVERGMVDALSRAGVPATLGMRWKVGEASARNLTKSFYSALFAGASAPSALRLARAANDNTPDWINPILEMHPD